MVELFFVIITFLILVYFLHIIWKKYEIVKITKLLTFIVFIFIMVLVYFPKLKSSTLPLPEKYVSSFINTFLYSIKMMVGGESIDELFLDYSGDTLLGKIYFYIVAFISIIAPILTSSLLIIQFSSFLTKFKYFLQKKSAKHVFTSINDNSMKVASSIYKNNNSSTIIFTNIHNYKEINEKYFYELKKIGAILLPISECDICVGKKMNVYAINDNPENNALCALSFVNLDIKNKSNITVFVYGKNEFAEQVLSSKKVQESDIKIITFDEELITSYQLLYENPLYKYINNGKLNILILGLGELGTKMLKSCLMCGQINNVELNIICLDKYASKIKEKIAFECPELNSNYYKIKYIDIDVKTSSMIDFLKKCKEENTEINYCIVSLKEDSLNREIGFKLDKYLLSNFKGKCSLNIRIKDSEKYEIYEKERYISSNNIYPINFFGGKSLNTIENLFFGELMEIAFRINLIYEYGFLNNDLKYLSNSKKTFFKPYNYESSLANAITLKYKLFQAGINLCDGKNILGNKELANEFKTAISNNEVFKNLVINEHNRWNTYIRTQGYTKYSINEALIYFNNIRKYNEENSAKLKLDYKDLYKKSHPALVDFEELKNVENKLNEINGNIKFINYVKSDEVIIASIAQILEEKNYFLESIDNP